MSISKKILIIYPVDFQASKNRGIYKKMIGQGRAFESYGFRVLYAFLEGRNCALLEEANGFKKNYATGLFREWAKYHRLFSSIPKALNFLDFELVYIRHLVFTNPLFDFLKEAKASECKIIYEFPTWPYEKEWARGMGDLLMSIDRRNKIRCLQQFDLVVHYGGFNRKNSASIQITNGIEVRAKNFISKEKTNFNSPLRLIAVGKWAYWHGLDRAIIGLAQTNTPIHMHVVGTGPELRNLQNLVRKHDLQSSVSFHGEKYGDELETLLAEADMGIGTLGLHRKSVVMDSSLKHRLYCANGLPFVLSSKDYDFNSDLPFCFYVADNDEPIAFEHIIAQHKILLADSNYSQKIYEYAKKNLSWRGRVKDIISCLQVAPE